MSNYEYKVLFLDIETSPNVVESWRVGYNLSLSTQNIREERMIICASWKWAHENKVYNKFWKKDTKTKNKYLKYNDKNVVETLIKAMDQADIIVGHNGDRFDIKWVRGRAMVHGIAMAPEYQTFDTLKKSRQYLNLNSNRLDYLGRLFCSDKKAETGGYNLWKEVMDGKKSANTTMQKYCDQDVVLLQEYYNQLLPYVTHNNHVGVTKGLPKWTCAHCGTTSVGRHGRYCTKTGQVKHRMKCKGKKSHFYTISDKVYRDWLKDR